MKLLMTIFFYKYDERVLSQEKEVTYTWKTL